MPVETTELIIYGAEHRPEDESSAVGGGIDVTARPFDAEIVTPGNIQIHSSGADTRTATARYRGNDGLIYSQMETLDGVNVVLWDPAITAERLIEVTLSATHGSNVVSLETAGGGTTLHTFAPSETKAFRLFIAAFSTTSEKPYYEKLFYKNVDPLVALQAAQFRATADPGSKLAVALETTVDGTGESTNRITVPAAGIGSWTEEGIDLAIPGTNLAAGSAIGFWARLTLAANEVPLKNTGTYQLRGQSA